MGILEYISKLRILAVKRTEEQIASIHYLEMVMDEKQEGSSEQWFDQPMERPSVGTIASTSFRSMKLAAKSKTVELSDIVVPLPQDLDPGNVVRTHLLKKILGGISYLAIKHKQEVESHSVKGLDVEISDTSDTSVRRVIAKVLACSNFVASNGRRGPATFVIASQDIINFINFQGSGDYIYEPEYSLAGLRLLACNDLGNTVIVGRGPLGEEKGNDGETGMVLISGDKFMPVGYGFDETQTDITDARIKYAISDVGDTAYHNYIQFDVKFTEEK